MYTLKKINITNSKENTKYWSTTHKYGVLLPNNPKEALQINRQTGNIYWEKAMSKDMNKAKVSYEEVVGCTPQYSQIGNGSYLTGYQEISCHLIFYVNMNFTIKARLVADVSTSETPVAL